MVADKTEPNLSKRGERGCEEVVAGLCLEAGSTVKAEIEASQAAENFAFSRIAADGLRTEDLRAVLADIPNSDAATAGGKVMKRVDAFPFANMQADAARLQPSWAGDAPHLLPSSPT